MSGIEKYLKYKELTYQKNFNLGNYESERIILKIDVDHDANIEEVFKRLKTKVHQLHMEGTKKET